MSFQSKKIDFLLLYGNFGTSLTAFIMSDLNFLADNGLSFAINSTCSSILLLNAFVILTFIFAYGRFDLIF